MKALLLCLVMAVSADAQQGRDLGRAPVQARRLALVIGNDAYAPPANPLHNAVNDARSMKASLEEVGFTVQVGLNLNLRQMDAVIGEFTGGVRPGDVALFFYSGHGLQVNDQNYLIPIDFQARNAVDAKYEGYPAQRVQENLEAAGAGMQILILDACRNNPFKSWRGGPDGLAAMQAGRGAYIAFATSPGKVADDNPGGRNGLFTGELIPVLTQAGLSIDQVFNRVREQVTTRSLGRQLPWSTSSITGEFYFKLFPHNPASATSHSPNATVDLQEVILWKNIESSISAADFQAYLKEYPSGVFVDLANARLENIRQQELKLEQNAEVALWKSIENTDRLQNFRTYLDKYPNGTFSTLARTRLQQLGDDARVSEQRAYHDDSDAKPRSPEKDYALPVAHVHAIGQCFGHLRLSPDRLDYRGSEHNVSFSKRDVVDIHVAYGTSLMFVLKNGRKWSFAAIREGQIKRHNMNGGSYSPTRLGSWVIARWGFVLSADKKHLTPGSSEGHSTP